MNDYLVGLLLFSMGILIFIFSLSYLIQKENYCKALENEYLRIKNQDYQRNNIIKI